MLLLRPKLDAVEVHALATAKRHFFGFYEPRALDQSCVAAERAFMAGGEPIAVRHAREPLEVRAWGAGPRVLLVHGLFVSGGKFMHLVPELVAAGLRPIAFDAPGHGNSAGAYTDPDEVASAIFSVESVTGPFFALVAHSMGVTWALRALQAGLTVQKAVCVAAPASIDSVEYYVERNELDGAVAAHFRRIAAAFTYGMTPWVAVAAELRARALIVHDRDDPLAPFEGAVALAAAWASSSTFWTSRLGHFKPLVNPAVMAEIATFLSGDAMTSSDQIRSMP